MKKYDFGLVEKKWQEVWRKEGVYEPDLKKAKKPFYNLMMFPYPSAEGLHVGNMYAFVGSDIYGRFKRMQGNDVFEPIGLDGFGIHSENYALKAGTHPAEQAKKSAERFYKQELEDGMMMAHDGNIKTFPLRGIKDSPPYMHDGRCFTLEDVVEYFNLIQQLDLKSEEKKDLAAFLRSL